MYGLCIVGDRRAGAGLRGDTKRVETTMRRAPTVWRPTRRSLLAVVAVALVTLLTVAACGDDDGAQVREIGDGGASASGTGSGYGSASAVAPSTAAGEEFAETRADGAYAYASNVDSHRLVVADICQVRDLLDARGGIDYGAVETIYRDGVNSVDSDGTTRSIGGFAARDDRSHGYDVYYGTPAPLDEWVSAALSGTGPFEGEADGVRVQGIEKGIQNAAMVAWVVHELNAALSKAAGGNFDIAEGAVHDWDEGWAFYHGSEPGCGPYATGNSRAANFDTVGADGETALANERIATAMVEGRDALVDRDAAAAEAAATEVLRNLVIIYSQAAIRYATLIEDDLAEGDAEAAREHQAEGLTFFRVIEPFVADAGADVAAINGLYSLASEPAAGGDLVRAALEPAWSALGISDEDIGELQ